MSIVTVAQFCACALLVAFTALGVTLLAFAIAHICRQIRDRL